MRQLRVTYRKQARSDLEEIYNSVLQVSQNKATAYNFYKRIVSRCNRIGLVPFGGRSRDDLEPGLRTVPFEHSAVIACKVEHDCVRIVNVFHGRRDYEGFYHHSGSSDRLPTNEKDEN